MYSRNKQVVSSKIANHTYSCIAGVKATTLLAQLYVCSVVALAACQTDTEKQMTTKPDGQRDLACPHTPSFQFNCIPGPPPKNLMHPFLLLVSTRHRDTLECKMGVLWLFSKGEQPLVMSCKQFNIYGFSVFRMHILINQNITKHTFSGNCYS